LPREDKQFLRFRGGWLFNIQWNYANQESRFMFRKILLTSLFILLMPISISAQTRSQKLDQFLDLIEFGEVFADLRPSVLGMLDNGQIAPDSPLGVKWQAAAALHFDSTQMQNLVIDGLEVALSENDLDRLIAIFEGDFPRRISALEIEVQNTTTHDDRREKGTEIALELANINANRLLLYLEMIETLGLVDQGVSTILNVQYSLLSGASVNGLLPAPMSDTEILRQVSGLEPGLRQFFRDAILADTAFTYKELTDKDVEQYLTILGQSEVKRFYSILGQVSGDLMHTEFAAFATKLGQVPEEREL
jgi:hypothetical protein